MLHYQFRRGDIVKVWLIPVVGLLGALILTACGGGDDPTPVPTLPTAPPTQAAAGDTGADGPRIIEIRTVGLTFVPATIVLKAGEPVQFKLIAGGTHTFTIPDLGIDQTLTPGVTVTTHVVTPQPGGTIAFFCLFHRGSGMTGKLNVS